MRVALLLVAFAAALVACDGLLGIDVLDDPNTSADDAGGAEANGPDADEGGPPDDETPVGPSPDAGCDANAPFGAPVLVDSLVAANTREYDARLSVDERTVYFSRSAAGATTFSAQVYVATRAKYSDPFGAPNLVDNLPQGTNTFAPSVTANGLHLYFNAGSDIAFNIFVASRQSTADPFSPASEVPNVNGHDVNGNPFIVPNDTALYFFSDHYGGGAAVNQRREIVVSTNTGGVFSAPALIPALDSDECDTLAVREDQRVIFFSSSRGGATHEDIWTSSRPSVDVDWGAPARVAEVSSSATDSPTWISADGCRLYLQSDRSGHSEIYLATRPN